MPTAAAGFSVKEAAAIVGVPELAVRKAIASRAMAPRAAARGRAMRYHFAPRDLVFVKLVTGFPMALLRSDKTAIRTLIGGARRSAGRWSLRDHDLVASGGGIEVKVALAPVRDAIAEAVRAYEAGRRRIDSRPDVLDGEPVFAGTRIPLAHVAALFAKGVALAEIKEDFPRLGDEDLAFARMVSRMKRDPGRPRKPVALLRNGQSVPTTGNGAEVREPPPR